MIAEKAAGKGAACRPSLGEGRCVWGWRGRWVTVTPWSFGAAKPEVGNQKEQEKLREKVARFRMLQIIAAV